jgi:hypothetical protein
MSPSSGRLFSALIIVSLLFSVLSTFPPPAANAQDEGGETPTPIAETQDGNVPTPTPETQDGNVPTPTPETQDGVAAPLPDDEVPADEDPPRPVEVGVFNFLCPPSVLLEDITRDNLSEICTIPGMGVEFTLTPSEGKPRSDPPGADGLVLWPDVPAGLLTVSGPTSPGYQLGPVYCHPIPPPDLADVFEWESFPVENGTISYDLPGGYALFCEFYNLPAAETEPEDEDGALSATPVAGESGSVIVHGYVCAAERYEDSFEDLQVGCPTPNLGMEVHLYSAPNQFSEQAKIIDDSPISFPAVPPGGAELNFPSDQYRLFCQTYLSGESNPPISGFAEVSVDIDVQAGYVIDCYRFSFLPEPDDTYSTITINKRLCGATYPDSSEPDDWREACTDPHPGVPFYVERSGIVAAVGTTDEQGIVTLRVEPGDLNIFESPPDEFPGGYAYCETRDEGAEPGYVNAGRLNPGDEEMWLKDTAEPHIYYCDWFNAPYDDGGNIVVTKWRCPEHYDATGASLEKLLEDCATPHEGVRIDVVNGSGVLLSEQTVSGKGGPAIARFEGIPVGDVGVGEPDPQGHSLERAFCSTGEISQPALTQTSGYVEHNVGDNGIPITIEAGKEIACHFFNVATGEADSPPKAGSVIIDKRICPPGFAAIAKNYIDVAMYCTTESGVEFTATQGETTLSAVTGEDGVAEFTGLSAGELRITELPKEGYDPPRVFCRETEEGAGETGELLPVTVDSWGVAYELRDGYYLQCVWANLPAAGASTDPGTVVLHAYTCPEGTGEYEPLASLLADCTAGPKGVKYTAGPSLPPPPPKEGATGAGGDVQFSNVTPGFVRIEELAGQGYDPIAAWCDYYVSATGSSSDYGWHAAEPLSAYIVGGQTFECSFFSVPLAAEEPQAPPAYEAGSVIIHSYKCPPGFAATNPPAPSAYYPYCTNEPAVEFTASRAGEEIGSAISSGSSATATIAGLSPGEFRISGFPREGYDSPRAYCRTFPAGEPGGDFLEVAMGNWGFNYEFGDGSVVECQWHNLPAAAPSTDPATVIVHKYNCPKALAERAGVDAYLADCLERPANHTFTAGAPGQSPVQEAATDAGGNVQFTGLAPGAYYVTDTTDKLYWGYERYCDLYVTAAGSESANEYAGPNAAYIYLAAGYTYECYFFETLSVDVGIDVAVCPPGDYAASGLNDLQPSCTPTEGVNFRLFWEAGDYEETGVTTITGTAAFYEGAPGRITMAEASPGYQTVGVFCGSAKAGGYNRVEVTAETVEYDAAPAEGVKCYWFSVEVPSVEVFVGKVVCPAHFDYRQASESDLEAACSLAKEGIEFEVRNEGKGYQSRLPVSADGYALFQDVPPGPVRISEFAPGYLPVRVICGDRDSGDLGVSNYTDLGIENATVEYVIGSKAVTVCIWINVEVEYAKVIVHKYGCDQGYVPEGHSYEDVLEKCPTPLEGVAFDLSAAAEGNVTDASGSITWEVAEPGPLTLAETPPPDYSGVLVFCTVYPDGGPAGAYELAPVESLAIERDVEAGYTLECLWFNYKEHSDAPTPGSPTPVPPSGGGGGNGGSGGGGTGGQGGGQTGGQSGGQAAGPAPDPDAPATLIITNYTCEPGYDVHGPNSDAIEDCEERTGDIEFALAAEGEDQAESRVTGADGEGRVEFADLEAGAYLLAETLPEETWLAFISTCQSDQRQFQAENPFLPFAYAGPDGQIGVVLVAGETLKCDWFNVPDKPGTLTLTDYSCPGDMVILSTCEPTSEGRAYTLTPLDDAEVITLDTGEDGTAVVEVEGTYEIVEEGFEWCFAESEALDAGGKVTIGPGEQVSVDIYTCGAQPGS